MNKYAKLLVASALLLSMTGYAKAETLDAVVAVANDAVITESQLSHQVQLLKQNLAHQHIPLPAEKVLRKQVLEHMISLSLQKQLAEKYEMKITDAEVDAAIQNIAANQRMTLDQLKAAVANDGMNYLDFREQIRDQILVQRVQQAALRDKIKITDQEVDNYMQLLKAQPSQPSAYHVQDILIALPESPTSDQIQAAKQKAEKIAEQLRKGANFDELAVAESSGEQALQRGDLGWRNLAEIPSVFADKVKTMRKGEISAPIRADNGFHIIKVADMRGGKPQQHFDLDAKVRQIYLKPNPNFPAKVYQEKLQQLRRELQHGAEFAKLAETYSDDPITAAKGGDMGWVKASSVSPAFAAVMSKLKAGQISQPFQTPAGWHLIQVIERNKVEDTADYKREQVKNMIFQRKFSEEVQNWLQQLRNGTYVKIMDKSLDKSN